MAHNALCTAHSIYGRAASCRGLAASGRCCAASEQSPGRAPAGGTDPALRPPQAPVPSGASAGDVLTDAQDAPRACVAQHHRAVVARRHGAQRYGPDRGRQPILGHHAPGQLAGAPDVIPRADGHLPPRRAARAVSRRRRAGRGRRRRPLWRAPHPSPGRRHGVHSEPVSVPVAPPPRLASPAQTLAGQARPRQARACSQVSISAARPPMSTTSWLRSSSAYASMLSSFGGAYVNLRAARPPEWARQSLAAAPERMCTGSGLGLGLEPSWARQSRLQRPGACASTRAAPCGRCVRLRPMRPPAPPAGPRASQGLAGGDGRQAGRNRACCLTLLSHEGHLF